MVSCRSLTHYVLTPPILAFVVVVQVIITLLLVINSYSLNNAAYKEQIDAPTLGQTHSSNLRNTVVVYNRIPKTGSTSLMQLPYELCNRNKYNVLLLNLTGGPRSYTMNLKDRMAFAWNITGNKTRTRCTPQLPLTINMLV